MTTAEEETEVKFYLQHPDDLLPRILAAGGRLSRPRTHETNLRFDTASGTLRGSGRLLRLRRDTTAYLTFKADTHIEDGALRRREIELVVEDFERAQLLLLALDYKIVFRYEKYRTIYEHAAAEIMVDELPYGNFVEIEGGREALKPLAGQLGLSWTCAIPRSYYALFEHMREARGLIHRDLTFSDIAGLGIQPAELGVVPADP